MEVSLEEALLVRKKLQDKLIFLKNLKSIDQIKDKDATKIFNEFDKCSKYLRVIDSVIRKINRETKVDINSKILKG